MGTLKVRVNGAWEPVSTGADGTGEVYVGLDNPLATDPSSTAELWYSPQTYTIPANPWDATTAYVTGDRTDHAGRQWTAQRDNTGIEPGTDLSAWTADASPQQGVLQALVNGGWQTVATTETTPDEVYVGPEDPDTVEPGSARELWFDTDAPADIAQGGIPVPPGGLTGQPLLKASDVDGETEWGTELDLRDGLGPRTTVSVPWINGFSGQGQFRVNPASVTLSIYDGGRDVDTPGGTLVKMCDYPADVPAPWRNLRLVTKVVGPSWTPMLDVFIEARTDGVYLQALNTAMGDVATDWNHFDATMTWTR